MKFVQSWKSSLALLRPENLKPFCLVTIKTVMDLFKGMNKPLTSRGNWILAIGVILLVGFTNVIKLFHLYWLEALLLNSMRYFLVFIFTLALRPSVSEKEISYYKEHLDDYFYVLLLTLGLGFIHFYLIPLAFIGYLFFLLFFFDSPGDWASFVPSMRNSFWMMLYNLPLCLVAYAVLAIINIILFYLVAFALSYFGGLTIAGFLYVLFVPVEVALITNLYIKFLHAQPGLYFKQPE